MRLIESAFESYRDFTKDRVLKAYEIDLKPAAIELGLPSQTDVLSADVRGDKLVLRVLEPALSYQSDRPTSYRILRTKIAPGRYEQLYWQKNSRVLALQPEGDAFRMVVLEPCADRNGKDRRYQIAKTNDVLEEANDWTYVMTSRVNDVDYSLFRLPWY